MLKEDIMKSASILVFLIICSSLLAVDLINETFPTTGVIPSGWTRTGTNAAAWSVFGTNFAGGTASELRLYWTPGAMGQTRFISPPVDTRKVHDMTLSFRHCLDDFSTTQTYTIGVQISHDLSNWTTLWSVTTSSDIAAEQVNLDIDYTLGMSQTTYIAFWFNGDNNNIDGWYIDNVLLSYQDTLGSGTWAAGTYLIDGNLIVPPGYTFTIPGGSTLLFDTGKSLSVQGSLMANGDYGYPVTFTSLGSGATWAGISMMNLGSTQDSTIVKYSMIERCTERALTIYSTNRVRFKGCVIANCDSNTDYGIVLLYETNAIVEECTFLENENDIGPIFYCYLASAIIRNNTFFNNNIGPSLIKLQSYNLSNYTGNSIYQNHTWSGYGVALHIKDCSGTLYRQMIANNMTHGIWVQGTGNTAYITNCLLVNNYGWGLINEGRGAVRSSILWGNNSGAIQNTHTGLTIRYSCVAGGYYGINGTLPLGENYTSSTSSNPLFVSPSPTSDDTSNPTFYNWTLQTTSPCIDTGDPAHPVDEDGSRVDMGMYSRKLKPIINRAADVPNDQGHQLDLKWLRNDLDVSYQPGAFYSVWREDGVRNGAVLLGSLNELPAALNSKQQDICWWDGDRTWYYLSQVPAFNFGDYGLVVSTLQDSSSTGTHASNYKVIYSNAQGYWQSIPQSGYTVDNIPPLPAQRLTLQASAPNQYLLAWDEVTEGIWEGNSYPEQNQVFYKVYASTDPSVPILPENLIGITASPQMLINSTTDKRFFKVVAFDTE